MNMIDLLSSLPGAVAQGLIWGIMAVGVYITYKLLDIADLTVDGSICTGAAVCTMMLLSGRSLWLAVLCAVAAGLLAGVVTAASGRCAPGLSADRVEGLGDPFHDMERVSTQHRPGAAVPDH